MVLQPSVFKLNMHFSTYKYIDGVMVWNRLISQGEFKTSCVIPVPSHPTSKELEVACKVLSLVR